MSIVLSRLPKWRQRVLVYKLFGLLPKGEHLFDIVRATVGLNRNFNLERRNYVIQEMTTMLKKANKTVTGLELAEIGAGWHPVLPILFYGMGAKRIVMTDIVPHINQQYVEQTLTYMNQQVEELAAMTQFSAKQLRARWQELDPHGADWQTVWRQRGIIYNAPFDFMDTGWPSESVDMIYSNSCLGYIPETILTGIFAESARLLRSRGFLAHDVSVYDDFSGIDKTITPLNFLNYSREVWERIGNSRLHYQNRCRPACYIKLAEQNNLSVTYMERLQHKLTSEMLNRNELDAEFRNLPEEELLCAHLLMIAEK